MSLNAIKHFLSARIWVLMFLLSFGHFGNVMAAESDPVWTRPAPEGGHFTSPPSISQDGTIYIGTYSYTAPQGYALTAINPDGTKKWVFPIDSTDSDFTPSTVGSDGIIYYTAGSKLYAINPNGIQKWVFTSPTALSASALGQDGTIYMGSLYNCSDGGLFYALNSADGTIKWTSSSVYRGNSPAIARDGAIYVYGCDSNLHALEVNGNLKWTFFLNGGSFNPPTVDADGTIYAGGSGRLTAINPDGTQKWIAPVQGVADGTSIAPDGTLYVATDIYGGKLYAINPDGTQKWIFSPQKQPNWFSYPAVGVDGTIYVGGYDKFYAINPDGTEKWTYGQGAWSLNSPALTADGTLIATNGATLYAFNLTSGGLATSPWPMLGHDPQHTGRQSTGTPPSIVFSNSSCGTSNSAYIFEQTYGDRLGTLDVTSKIPLHFDVVRAWLQTTDISNAQVKLRIYKVSSALDPLTSAALIADSQLATVGETASEVSFSFGTYVDMSVGDRYVFAFTVDGHTWNYPDVLSGWGHTAASGCDFWEHFIEYDDHTGATPNDVYTATNQLAVSFVDTGTLVDTDGDGLPNWYEDQYGLNKNDPADAALDADGDGLTNRQEFMLGTGLLDPTTQSGFLNVIPTTALDFGPITVGQSSPNKDFTVQNTGNAMLNVSCTTALPFSFAFGDCAYVLAPNEFADIALNFSPAAEGPFNGTVNFSSNGGNDSRSVTGSGTLTPPPQGVISVNTNNLDFGNLLLANSLTKTITVTNTGAANLKLGVLSKTGEHPDDFLLLENNCDNKTLETSPLNNSCWFSIAFEPSVVGPRTAEVIIPSVDAMATAEKIFLQGGGYDEYNFANIPNKNPYITYQYEIFDRVFEVDGSSYKKFSAISALAYGTEGNCFGMALSSIKAAKGFPPYNPSVHSLTEPSKSPSGKKWDTPQIPFGEINPVLSYIIENQISQFADNVNENYDVIETLLENQGKNITNHILNLRGQIDGKNEGHVVLPYRIETVNDTTYKVYVYDPNRLALGSEKDLDKRYVTFTKVDGIWNWKFVLWPLSTVPDHLLSWSGRENDNPKTIFLTNVAAYDISGVKRLTYPSNISVQGVNSSIILSDSGLQTGYTSTTDYNEIPDISLFTPAGAVFNNDEKHNGAWFRGNLKQNLRLQTIPSLGGEVRVIKWTPDSQIETKIQGDTDGTELFIAKNNDTVSISSITGTYELVLNNDRGGVEHSINISGKSDNPASKYTYSLDWDKVISGDVQVVMSVDANGDGRVDYSSTHSGNTLSDNQAPTTTHSVEGTTGQNGWYTSDVTVSLSATDGSGVGVKATSYSLDNSPWQTYDSASPIVIMTEGIHTLQFYSTDFFGNKEETRTLILKIDKTAPTVNILAPAMGTDYLLQTTQNASYTCSDATSGVASCSGPVASGSAFDTAMVGSKNFARDGTRSGGQYCGCDFHLSRDED